MANHRPGEDGQSASDTINAAQTLLTSRVPCSSPFSRGARWMNSCRVCVRPGRSRHHSVDAQEDKRYFHFFPEIPSQALDVTLTALLNQAWLPSNSNRLQDVRCLPTRMAGNSDHRLYLSFFVRPLLLQKSPRKKHLSGGYQCLNVV